jgi:transcriptional antiterminator NusG
MTEKTNGDIKIPGSLENKFKWYVIHTNSGAEKKVKEDILDRCRKASMSEFVKEVMVPVLEVSEIKKGKKIISEKKFMPSYVLMNVNMTNDLWHLIKSTQKVSGFLGSGKTPIPVSEKEVANILRQIEITEKKVKQSGRYFIGDSVKVNDGPFESFSGVVEEVDENKSRLRVAVTIFGRVTPLDLSFTQVEKIVNK